MTGPGHDPTQQRGSRGTLEIRGPAGTTVAVFASAPTPASSPRIFHGQLPASGRLRLRVPRQRLRILVGAHAATVDFSSGAPYQCVDAPP